LSLFSLVKVERTPDGDRLISRIYITTKIKKERKGDKNEQTIVSFTALRGEEDM
jgi:hypothetical protein